MRGEVVTEETAAKLDAIPRERLFAQFVYSLYGQVLVLLGDLEHPETGKRHEPSLDQARYLIDVLDVLAEKTKGNLDKEEDGMLGAMLSELKMRHFQKRA